MEEDNKRWKKRFENYTSAFNKLKEAVELNELNELERNGLIQRFEFTIDLSWKVMIDFLQEKGFSFKPSPKDTFRIAQQAGYIDFAQILIGGLDMRNELSHDYNGTKFETSEKFLRQEIYPAMEKLYQFFNKQF
ncbi:MAG TPA: HI0074 family nucleotidyltransferase substrate-binding subunit [Saprospiraceae bacterium]|nr:nucleotidyltransferase [Saprospirales bacterium]HRQ29873.1 HI0074 family nucleotidyltransferase substrate-binding subunit [Saprospiraceae bacterium]